MINRFFLLLSKFNIIWLLSRSNPCQGQNCCHSCRSSIPYANSSLPIPVISNEYNGSSSGYTTWKNERDTSDPRKAPWTVSLWLVRIWRARPSRVGHFISEVPGVHYEKNAAENLLNAKLKNYFASSSIAPSDRKWTLQILVFESSGGQARASDSSKSRDWTWSWMKSPDFLS